MFKTPYNFDSNDPKHYETPTGVSMTVPDMSYSIQDLFERYRVGIPPEVALRPEYPDGDNPDFDDLSPIETAQDLVDIDNEIAYVEDIKRRASASKAAKSNPPANEEDTSNASD